MKKILAVVVALILALGCLGMTAVAEEKPLIGILAPAVTHGWVAAVAYNAELRCKELGLEYNVVTSSNADTTPAKNRNIVVPIRRCR